MILKGLFRRAMQIGPAKLRPNHELGRSGRDQGMNMRTVTEHCKNLTERKQMTLGKL